MILGTELTLHWNGIEGVYSLNSTGQLIPMLVRGLRRVAPRAAAGIKRTCQLGLSD